MLLCTLILTLSSCKRDDECIDPDDWGGVQNLTVSSFGSSRSVHEDDGIQTIDWQQGPKLDGNRVVMEVRNIKPQLARKYNCQQGVDENGERVQLFTPENSWVSIWGKFINPSVEDNPYGTLDLCTFQSYLSDEYPWCPLGANMNIDDLPVVNLPCKLYRGLGLYSVVANVAPSDGNLSCTFGKDYLFHIGDSISILQKEGINNSRARPSMFFNQGCPTGGASFIPPKECMSSKGGCYLYFKIMDRFYGTGEDNYGSYTVEFKQGVQADNIRIITRFVGIVNAIMCDIAETMYKSFVQQKSFIGYVRVMLVLTIAFLGISTLTGFSELNHKEMLILVLKIGVVLQLISPTSWEFFNSTLFKFFTNGIGEITGIIFGAGDVSPIDVELPDGIKASEQCRSQSLAGFSAFDDVLAQLFSRATTIKVLSLFAYKGAGFLYVPIIYICLVVVLFILLKSLLIYLVSILIISVIISLAPLFISFILFEKTKDIFDKWLKTLISYFVQPIIIMTFAFFVLQIFLAQMHNLLGVRVCWKEWADLKIFKLYAWKADYDSSAPQCMLTPGPILQYCDPGSPKCKGGATGSDEELEGRKPGQQFNMVGDLSLARFPFDGRGSCNGKGNDANITAPENASCTPYTCTQERYIDFPYLDPAFPPDQSRVEELKGGTVISIKDIVILIMLIWFMYEFNKLVPNIAKQLASGGTGGGVNLNATASSLGGAMFDYMAKAPASKISEATGLAGTARAIRFGVVGIKEAVQDKMYKNLVKPIEDRVDPLKKAIEKKMENSSAIRALKVGATIVKGILKPHEVAGYMVSKVGENLQHKKEVAKKGVANVANKAKEAILGKAGQAKDAVMRRFGGGDKTPPQDAGAAPRGGVPSAGVPTPGAQGAGAQPNQPTPRATEADGTVAPEGEAANPDSEAALADGHDVQGPNAQTTPRAAEAGVLAGSEGEVANPDSEAAQADGHDVQGPHAQRTPQAAAGEAYNPVHAAHADGDELAAEAPLAQLAPRDAVSGVKAGLSDEAINPALAEAQADQPAEGAQADGQASAEAKDAAEDLAAGTDGTEKAANSPDEAAGSATDGQAPAEVKDAAEELTARTDIKEEAANTPDGAAGSALDDEAPAEAKEAANSPDEAAGSAPDGQGPAEARGAAEELSASPDGAAGSASDDEAPAPAQPASEVSYDEPAQPTKDSAADPLTDRIKKAIDEKAALDAKSARMAEFEEAADAITEEQPHTPDEGKDKRDGST